MGYNHEGRIGDGTTTHRSTPVKVVDNNVTKVAVHSHTLFIKTNGSLWGMGRNHHNILKKAGTGNYLSPVRIVDSGVTRAAIGYWFLIYLKENLSIGN